MTPHPGNLLNLTHVEALSRLAGPGIERVERPLLTAQLS